MPPRPSARRGQAAVVPDLRPERRRQRQGAGRRLPQARRPAGHRWHRQSPRAARRHVVRVDGRQAESALLDAGHRHQRNSIPNEPQRRLVLQRHPVRLSRADHQGLRRDDFTALPSWWSDVLKTPSRMPPRRPSTRWRRKRPSACMRRSAELLNANPLYPGCRCSPRGCRCRCERPADAHQISERVSSGYSYFHGRETGRQRADPELEPSWDENLPATRQPRNSGRARLRAVRAG